ncbi:MAG: GNAT family N-acetyltransferase [Anaerolineales bacterium]
MIVRPGTAADAEAIARVHVQSWQTTYKGLVPDGFLQNLTVQRRAEQWRAALTIHQDTNHIFVAEMDEDGIVGFVASGAVRDGRREYTAEIFAIYLTRTSQGRGLGRLLFEAAVADLKQRGHPSMMLWVLADNPSRGFYERMGGLPIDEKEIELGGLMLKEVAYGWKEI